MSEQKTERTIHATHMKQQIYESTLDFVHGMPMTIDRIVVDMSNDMNVGPWVVIYFHDGHLGSFMVVGYKRYQEMKLEYVKDVEISDELFMTAIELNNIHQRVRDRKLDETFKNLTAEK